MTDWVADLVRSGRIADIALVCLAVEAIVTIGWRRSLGASDFVVRHLVHLAAGALMLVALRAALSGWAWYWVAGPLTVAMVAHICDIALGLRGRTRG